MNTASSETFTEQLLLTTLSMYNSLQNILEKVKKSSKVTQDRKTLIPVFANFCVSVSKTYFFWGYWTMDCVTTHF